MAKVNVKLASSVMIEAYRRPSITGYNRLENSPRSVDLDRNLQGEIRDPLWMLTRQWQFGEFKGDDAGSPVSALILGEHTQIDRISFPGNKIFPYQPNLPLEAGVESEPLKANLALSLQMARYFLKLMRAKSISLTYLALLAVKYNLAYTINSNDRLALRLQNALGANVFDGFKLYQDILTISGGTTAFAQWLATQSIPVPDQTLLNGVAIDFLAWTQRNYTQPADTTVNAWEPSQLEYQFEIAAAPLIGVQKTLTADQFYGGHLDWYSFDLDVNKNIPLPTDGKGPATGVTENLVSFIPTPVTFKGMPYPRIWTMEDSQTNFGKMDATPTGLMNMLLAEFGLIYGNDWFLLPYPLKTNTICEIKGLLVLDVFGTNVLINPAGTGPESAWQRWDMFHQTSVQATRTPNHLFYLAPSVEHSLQGDPLEVVQLLRDNMASMVWGVETTVQSQAGTGVNGNEMALKNTSPPPFVPAGNASIRYVLGTTVPDNWTPFIPVHIQGSDTEIQLQRARMPAAPGPYGVLLNEVPAPYYINEEEVPRAGINVQRNYKRARWLNGKTILWLGRVKQTGEGEGWSNLVFDQIENIP